MNSKLILPLIFILGILALGWFYYSSSLLSEEENITSFEECVEAGYPVMESYPRKCSDGTNLFVEEILDERNLSQDEALVAARSNTECLNAGSVSSNFSYNKFTKTWWFEIERSPEQEGDGCNPACVVSDETESVEVNWRCTGLNSN